MDVDPVGVGVGVRHGPDVDGAVVVTQRRRNATAAFWSIAAFTVILVAGLAAAGTLYQQQVNSSIRLQEYQSCMDRAKLQVEHNDLVVAVNVALTDFAESRLELAKTAPPRDAAVMRGVAGRLTELAAGVDPIPVSKCRQ